MHRENKNANAMCQNLWDAVEAVQSEVHRDKCPPQ